MGKIILASEAIMLIPGYDPHAGLVPEDRDGRRVWVASDGTAYYFDGAKGHEAVAYFHGTLTHVKGEKAGQFFVEEPWQQAIDYNLFGWRRVADDLRRYRTLFLFVPRKNGKSPKAAGLIVYLLDKDAEPGAEIYGAAAEYRQASLVFEHARGMVMNDPELSARYQIYNGQAKAIQDDNDFSTYRVISSEAYSKHGMNLSAAVVDEVHALADGELIDVLETATAARRQPLMIYITTSDYEREESPCNKMHEYACQVRDGIVDDPTYLPVIYEASKDDDWTDPAVWAKANPNLGVSVSLDYIRKACKKAQATPSFENTFKRLHLNIRTEQDVRWLGVDVWDGCQADFEPGDLAGEWCIAGVDAGATRDITNLTLYFPDGSHVLEYFWVPIETARQVESKSRIASYLAWGHEGWLTLTDGNVADYDAIRGKANELNEAFNIKEIAIDRWATTQLQTHLQQDGFEVVPFGQGFKDMSPAMKGLETALVAGRLKHRGNPVMRWMFSNVAAEEDAAGNIKPNKKKSGGKIDGMVALIMCVGRALVQEGPVASVYEERGVLTL